MKRGDLWWVNFDPSLGSEIQKTRPAVIVSNDSANRHLNRLQVVPVTSKVDRLYPSEAYITVAGQQRKALADQITTVTKGRLIRRIGALSKTDVDAVERAMRTQLRLR